MVGLLGVSAFFSACETAIFSLEPVELERRTRSGGVLRDSLAWCVAHGRTVLLTIVLSNLAANIGYFSLAGWWASSSSGFVATAVTIGALIALVFLAEILPKSVALGMAGPLASVASPALRVWSLVLAPLGLPFAALVQALARRVASAPAVARTLTGEELETMVRRHPERFGLGKRSAVVVGELVGVTEIQVREVMVPIVDLEHIEGDETVAAAVRRLAGMGLRYLLVPGPGGASSYVDAKDLLVADPKETVRELARSLVVIPELARIPHLLELFRTAGVDHVLVVDEYGNEAGLIGRENLTESIVGGLARAEHAADSLPVRLRPHRGWEVAGSLGVHEFEDLFSVRLPVHRNRTIGGLVIEQIGSLPARGERVRIAGLTLEVLGVSRGRVHTVLVCFDRESSPQPAEDMP